MRRWLFVVIAAGALCACEASHVGSSGDGGRVDAGRGAVDGGGAPIDASARDAASADAGTTGSCDVPSQCRLRPESCCGSCGAATPTDMIALPVSEVAAYEARVCMDVGCPECARPTDPYLLATCRARRCVAIDLHVDPLTSCTRDEECTLAPAVCCACGVLGPEETISYNPARGSLGSLHCDPDADCPPCAPVFDGLAPVCRGGRCEVAVAMM